MQTTGNNENSLAHGLNFEPYAIDHLVDDYRHHRLSLDPEFPFAIKAFSYETFQPGERLTWHNRLEIFCNLNLPMPFPDALQEFKVETSALPARYGHHAASAVNVLTKTGGNQYHGDAFWFVRNYAFNARNFFATQRDSLKRNQYGGVIGGPIKTNKLFICGRGAKRIRRSSVRAQRSATRMRAEC